MISRRSCGITIAAVRAPQPIANRVPVLSPLIEAGETRRRATRRPTGPPEAPPGASGEGSSRAVVTREVFSEAAPARSIRDARELPSRFHRLASPPPPPSRSGRVRREFLRRSREIPSRPAGVTAPAFLMAHYRNNEAQWPCGALSLRAPCVRVE